MRQLECCGGPTVVVRPMSKTGAGNFFEDFRIGQVIRHATPRTITVGDVALYNGLFGPRFAVQSSDVFARAIGYPCSPVDDLLVFHVVFGKTVPDISLNAVGEKIDHIDGITVEEAEHQIATRLNQNTARIHFDQFSAAQGRFGRRLIYGGHVISLARALSFNGIANAFHIAAINGGRHVSPLFAGSTVFAWSEILAKADVPGRDDVGAVRLRTIATKERPCADFPLKSGNEDDSAVLLDLDYWVLMPR